MIQAICFDFNGVIINDEPLQMAAYQELLGEQGIQLTEEDYYGALGMDDRTFVKAAFQRANKQLTDENLSSLLARKVVRHRELIADELPFFPGVVTFLKSAARHYSLALVSMAAKAEIEYVLERGRLRELFSVIVSSEDVTVCKPAPDCYVMALARLNERRRSEGRPPLLGSECLVIEDAPPGIESGRGAGMRAMGVSNTVSDQQLRTAGAEVVTRSLADLTVDTVHLLFDSNGERGK